MNYNQNNKKNPNYKHGRSTYQHYCKRCGKKVCWKADRCLDCFHKTRTSKIYNCKSCNKKITRHSNSGKCKTCINQEHWADNVYAQKMRKKLLKALLKTPNKKEKFLNRILNSLLLKEYKFVGNGEVILGGFNPDFININGQKKIIELYGDYWHNRLEVKERDKRRIKTYKKYGYKTLIVWEHELKDLDIFKNKILEFNKKV